MTDLHQATVALGAQVSATRNSDVWFTLDAPRVALEPLLDHPEALGAWLPAAGAGGHATADGGFVVFGAAERFVGHGDERFEAVRHAAQARLDQLALASGLGAQLEPPRVFGGIAFQAGRAAMPPWTGFGDAQFVLPRMLYSLVPSGAVLSVFLPKGDSSADSALTEALKLRELLPALAAEKPGVRTLHAEECSQFDRSDWSALVELALAHIQSGAARKLVLARRRQLDFAEPLSSAATLQALSSAHAATTRFAFVSGSATFMGATPELLVKKFGLDVATEALAGTFRRVQADFAAELLRSPKEHDEHRPVLQAILDQLRPFTERIDYPSGPELRELPQLLHLRTPIQARLRSPMHVLDLVRALHPTPAVGGAPTQEALNWIDHSEPYERGWYAGPVGWFDRTGDGEFVVALRSGVLQGNRATAYAGAGIVQGSDPLSEYRETELKFAALLSGLRARRAD